MFVFKFNSTNSRETTSQWYLNNNQELCMRNVGGPGETSPSSLEETKTPKGKTSPGSEKVSAAAQSGLAKEPKKAQFKPKLSVDTHLDSPKNQISTPRTPEPESPKIKYGKPTTPLSEDEQARQDELDERYADLERLYESSDMTPPWKRY